MELKVFFLDTYALFEIIQGNHRYRKYMKAAGIITTRLNLMELFYGLLLKYDAETAEKYYNEFLDYCITISDEIVKAAMIFRFKNKEKGLSYVDCIGYALARACGAQFLTGDNAFEGAEGVEFVK